METATRRRRHLTSVIVVTALAGSALAACGSGAGGASGSSPIVIGVDAPLTGPFAALGQSREETARAYVDSVNADGGVDGRQIKLVVRDSAGDASKAAANMTELVTAQSAVAVLGDSLSDACAATAQIATQRRVPVICDTPPDLLQPVQKYVFNTSDLMANGAGPFVDAAKKVLDNPPAAKVAILTAASPGGEEEAKAVTAAVKAAGWDVVSAQSVPISEPDVSTFANKAAASNPDVVYLGLLASVQAPFMEVFRSQAPAVPVIGGGQVTTYASLKQVADPDFYGLSAHYHISPDSTGTAAEKYVKAMKAAGVTSPENLNGAVGSNRPLEYLSTEILVEALKACHGCTGEDLASAMESVKPDVDGLTPAFSFTPDRHYGATQYVLYQWAKTATKQVGGPYEASGIDLIK